MRGKKKAQKVFQVKVTRETNEKLNRYCRERKVRKGFLFENAIRNALKNLNKDQDFYSFLPKRDNSKKVDKLINVQPTIDLILINKIKDLSIDRYSVKKNGKIHNRFSRLFSISTVIQYELERIINT
jgi:hypothetical protein